MTLLRQRHATKHSFTQQASPVPLRRAVVARAVRPVSSAQPVAGCSQQPGRRELLAGAWFTAAALLAPARPASAFVPPPPGFRLHVDKLDGYTFVYPDQWATVTTSGNDIFLRDPFSIEDNLFVDISSPSSSRFSSVADLGSPEDAAAALLDKYLNKEFMSTRIGVKRTGEVVSATTRQGKDGNDYYDIQVRVASYASRNPYVATQAEVMADYGLEWDRRLVTTLGVANSRRYELRLQTSSDRFEALEPTVRTVQDSFRVFLVEE